MVMTQEVVDAGIFRQIEEKDNIVKEVIEYAYEYEKSKHSIDYLVRDTAYHEIKRLEKNKKKKDALAYWQRIYQELLTSNDIHKIEILRNIISYHANDIVGNFDPKVYSFATHLLPRFMSFFFNAFNPTTVLFSPPDEKEIDKIVRIQGKTAETQALAKKGTVILVPTHSSNMDSIVVGWSLYRLGLPPFTYGAGKNLFTNPILSYFMHNLGAYRVDRRLKHELYKDILKIYSQVVLQRNFHSLFFPGGTRSRSNCVESKLKLGLLGTGIKAYINNLLNNKAKPNIYVVPCTINYHIVLEAESLIDDYLGETGKARYITQKDESSSFIKVLNFMFKTARMETSLYINYGSALDLFGNKVNEDGESIDNHGRIIDPRLYVKSKGEIRHDEQRDAQYTKELGEKIAEDYLANNVILSTHLVAFCIFQHLKLQNPDKDLYRLVRLNPDEAIISADKVYDLIDKIKQKIIYLHNHQKITLEQQLFSKNSNEIVTNAIKHFNTYYKQDLITVKYNNFILNNVKLLYYYQNRLSGYELEKLI